jgi:predicted permease
MLWHDSRYALRTLLKQPGYALVVLLTLALGIGANSAIFSVVNGVLLRPLPYDGGERVVRLQQSVRRTTVAEMGFSVPEVADYRDETSTLDGVVEYHTLWFTLVNAGDPERVQTGVVSWNYFDVLGVRPLYGRALVEADDHPGAAPVLVLSHHYWKRRFGGDPEVVGKTVKLNGMPHLIVGVLPPIPRYPNAADDVYMPASACPFRTPEWLDNRDIRALTVFGRIKGGATIDGARRDIERVAIRLRHRHPDSYPPAGEHTIAATPLYEELTQEARPTLVMLLATAGFVLLIVCANVANLTLARLMRRGREITIRSALGAGRRRLMQQLLTESCVLALLGGGLGLLLAIAGLDLLVDFAGRFTVRTEEIGVDGTVAAFTLVISLATGVAVGLVPALPRHPLLQEGLKEGGARVSAGGRVHRMRSALIVAQLAVSFILLSGAGLMVRSLLKLQDVDPGFNAANVLTMRLDLDFFRYTPQGRVRIGRDSTGPGPIDFYATLLDRLRWRRGIESYALAGDVPLQGGLPTVGFWVDHSLSGDEVAEPAQLNVVSEDYFRTVGVSLLTGRTFKKSDRQGTQRVAVVNRGMAVRHWGLDKAVGQRISMDRENWITVVGVVNDVRQDGLASTAPDQVYFPLRQSSWEGATLFVRAACEATALTGDIVSTVRQVDPQQPVAFVRTLAQVRDDSLASSRLSAVLLGMFASLALIISAAGIAGVIGYAVTQRTHEIGIRIALGAGQGRVITMVLRQGAMLIAIGLGLGALGSLALTQLMGSLLFEVKPTDPLTYVAVMATLAGVAAVAVLLPARRAISIDPVRVLSSE